MNEPHERPVARLSESGPSAPPTPDSESRATTARASGWWWLGVSLACALGLVLRLLAIRNEFWLDEIWSWQAVHSLRWPWQIATDFRSDNNHHLNSLVLWLWPAGIGWSWYRLHSLLAGLASLVVAAWAANGSSVQGERQVDGVFAALLLAGNYWLVAASTEARGYAFAVLFALLSWGLLRRVLADGRTAQESRPTVRIRWQILFGFSVVLGFLSHLTFLHCYIGLFLWSLRHFARHRTGPGQELLALARLHGMPVALVGAFYLISVRGMELGGGPPAATWEVIGRLLTLGVGWSGSEWLAVWWILLAMLVFVAGLRVVYRADGDEWVFFLVAVVVSPAVFLLKRPAFLFERYFLISFVFFLVLLARVLGAIWRAGASANPHKPDVPAPARGRANAKRQAVPRHQLAAPAREALACAGASGSCVMFLLLLVANLSQVADFLRTGRGQFFPLLALVQARDPNPVVTVASDFEIHLDPNSGVAGDRFRVEKYLGFYAPYLPADKPLVYVRGDALPDEGVGWLIVHRVAERDPREPPGQEYQDRAGNLYRLELASPGASPAAWGWFVYRNANSKPR